MMRRRLLVGLGILSVMGGLYLEFSRPQKTLPVLSRVLPFTLTNQENQPVNEAFFLGRITVVNFIFTECLGQCPLMSRTMESLATKLGKKASVQFVSITVDPKNDTPDVLLAHARRFKIPEWQLLTGDPEVIRHLSEKSFLLAVNSGGLSDLINHSSRMILVDPQGQIRGYWEGTEESSVKPLSKAIAQLRKEKAS